MFAVTLEVSNGSERISCTDMKIIPKTAEDLADEALMRELAETGALDSPGIYKIEDLEADDAELRAQGK